MEFTVLLNGPFNLGYTLESGQVFRWKRREGWWYGEVAGGSLKVRQEEDVLRCETSSDSLDSAFVTRYFRLDEDLERVVSAVAKDETMSRAAERFYGLRLVRQDRWECLASFVLATNANIPRIEKMVGAICARYGAKFQLGGEDHYSFPTPAAIAGASVTDLAQCGLGYRAPFLRRVSGSVSGGQVDFAAVASLPYDEARRLLFSELFGQKVLLGVGPKVADCVLLYSCEKDDAFPIDVWIVKALAKYYPRLLPPSFRARRREDLRAKLSPKDYTRTSVSARKHFGRYAGYAQQLLYMTVREAES